MIEIDSSEIPKKPNPPAPRSSLSDMFDAYMAARQSHVEAKPPLVNEKIQQAITFGTGGFPENLIWYEPVNQDTDDMLMNKPTPAAAVEHMTLSEAQPGICFGGMCEKPDRIMGKRNNKDGHVLVVGHSGSGKTTSVVNPTMETGTGYRVFLDVKGELLEHHRRIFGEDRHRQRLVFDPYQEKVASVFFDPFAVVRKYPDRRVDCLKQLAEFLIPDPQDGNNGVWVKSAIALVTGALIHHFNVSQNTDQSETAFMDAILDINIKSPKDIIGIIHASDDPNDTVARFFVDKLKDLEDKQISDIGMHVVSNLPILSASDAFQGAFSPQKSRKALEWTMLNEPLPAGIYSVDIFIELQEDMISIHRPIYQIIIDELILALTKRRLRTYGPDELPPVSLILDEFTLLGVLPELVHGLQTLRSRGVTIVLITQSISDLERTYGKPASRGIIDNCAYKVVLGCMDVESQQYFANLVGKTIFHQITRGLTWSSGGINLSLNEHISRDYVIQPHSFASLNDTAVVVSPYGCFSVNKRKAFNGEHLFPNARRRTYGNDNE